jgi:hypothetical protein
MRKLLTAILLFVSVLLFTQLNAIAVDLPHRTDHQLSTYWYTTDKKATIAWDAPDALMGDLYELKLAWLETGTEYLVGSTPNLEYAIQAPRVGHFEIFLRAVRPSEPEAARYSPWVRTTDPTVATVDGQPKGWILYFQMAAPGGVIIGLNLNLLEELRNDYSNKKSPVESGSSSRLVRLQPVLRKSDSGETEG